MMFFVFFFFLQQLFWFFSLLSKLHLKRSCQYFIFSFSVLFLANIFQHTLQEVLALLIAYIQSLNCIIFTHCISVSYKRCQFRLKMLGGKQTLQECLNQSESYLHHSWKQLLCKHGIALNLKQSESEGVFVQGVVFYYNDVSLTKVVPLGVPALCYVNYCFKVVAVKLCLSYVLMYY